MMTHTPGPWKCKLREHTLDFPSKGLVQTRVNGQHDGAVAYAVGEGKQQCDANARLIASSPDLLEHLQRLVNIVTHPSATKKQMRQIADEARAVIALATGKVLEESDHDDCLKCGTPSVPGEGVPDQALRGCPKCEETWFEDLNAQPRRGAWGPDED